MNEVEQDSGINSDLEAGNIVNDISERTPLFGKEHKEYLLQRSTSTESNKRRKRLTFAAFALLYFTMSASYSVIAPFFPVEADKKGANGVYVGLIFGIFAFVTFIFSPIIGALIPIVGVHFFLFAGMFVIGVAEFLFGFLKQMPDGTVFIVFSFILRSFDGIGGAAAMTAAVAFLAQCFPDNVGSVMGSLELFGGLGLTLGPLIGGVLYEYGGFCLPFFVLAGLMLLSLPVIVCILPPVHEDVHRSSNSESTNKATIMKLLKIPSFDIIVNTIVINGMAMGIIEPTLAPHLKSEFHITSSTKVGLLFFLYCGTYAIFAPIFGWMADKTDGRKMMTFGCFTSAIGFFLLGPAPLSFMPKSIYLVTVAMGVIGIAFGPCFVPAIAELEKIVQARGYPDDLATHGIISGIFGAAFNVGAFLGPTLSGIITEYIHFSWTCTGFGILLLIQTVFLLGLSWSKRPEKIKDPENLPNGHVPVESHDNQNDIKT